MEIGLSSFILHEYIVTQFKNDISDIQGYIPNFCGDTVLEGGVSSVQFSRKERHKRTRSSSKPTFSKVLTNLSPMLLYVEQ